MGMVKDIYSCPIEKEKIIGVTDKGQFQGPFDLPTGLQIRVRTRKLFFLFLNQNICCGYSKDKTHVSIDGKGTQFKVNKLSLSGPMCPSMTQ